MTIEPIHVAAANPYQSLRELVGVSDLPLLGENMEAGVTEIDAADLLSMEAGSYSNFPKDKEAFSLNFPDEARVFLKNLGSRIQQTNQQFQNNLKRQSVLLRFDRVNIRSAVAEVFANVLISLAQRAFYRIDNTTIVFVNVKGGPLELHQNYYILGGTCIILEGGNGVDPRFALTYAGRLSAHLRSVLDVVRDFEDWTSTPTLLDALNDTVDTKTSNLIKPKDMLTRLKYLYDMGLVEREKDRYNGEDSASFKYRYFDPRRKYLPNLPGCGNAYQVYTMSKVEDVEDFGGGVRKTKTSSPLRL